MDIIETSEGSRNGFLAMDAIDYAKCILHILNSTEEENDTIRTAARYIHFVVVSEILKSSYSNQICLFELYAKLMNFFSLEYSRASCDRFSEEEFKNQFLRAVTLLFE